MTPRHSLSQRDPEARTAVCSICGPVGIYRAGRGFVCANKQREMNRRWAERNPGNAAASRQKPGAHRITDQGGSTGYTCVLCGPVDVVPWGRGWTCGNRARELRTNQQGAPVQRCPDCKRWLSSEFDAVDGRCQACHDIATPGQSLNGLKTYGRDPDKVALDVDAAWESDLDVARWNSLHRPDDGKDRTEPGLKTLGNRNVPPEWAWALKRNPEWWRLDQMEGDGNAVRHEG